MKQFMESIRKYFTKDTKIDNNYSFCRDAQGNLKDYCRIENLDR